MDAYNLESASVQVMARCFFFPVTFFQSLFCDTFFSVTTLFLLLFCRNTLTFSPVDFYRATFSWAKLSFSLFLYHQPQCHPFPAMFSLLPFSCYFFHHTFIFPLLPFIVQLVSSKKCYFFPCFFISNDTVPFLPVIVSPVTFFFFYLKSLLFSCYIFPVFLSKHQNDAVSRSSHLYNRNPYTRKDDLHIGTGSGKTPGWKKKVLQNMLNF